MRKIVLVILLLVIALPAHAQEASAVVVVWADDGGVWYWRSDVPETRQLAEMAGVVPDVAPDGLTVAFWQPEQADIGLIDAATAELTWVDFQSPDHQITPDLEWSKDGQTLYFMTDVGSGLSRQAADDLWQADVHSGSVEQLLPDGEGGRRAFLSPDGAYLAIVAAGQYAQEGETSGVLGRIQIYDLEAGQVMNTLQFPSVASASEWPWYPSVRWLADSSGILTALPPADLVYGATDKKTVLALIPVEGAPAIEGQVEADFFGLPEFSADGEWVAYLEQRESPEYLPHQLIRARRDGSDPQPYWQLGERGALFYNWLPGTNQIQIQEAGADGVTSIWVGRPDETPSLLTTYALAGYIQWVDETRYVFSTGEMDGEQLKGFALYSGTTVIARSESIMTFDAALVPQ
ncbi:MAG TPA: hypothetical protein VHP83_26960 [Aggregatilineaceae bacterium]|nr:hypothetical protein [Aggregatilineaceae bacterium]